MEISSGKTVIYTHLYPLLFVIATAMAFFAETHGLLTMRGGGHPPAYVKWVILGAGGISSLWAIARALMIHSVSIENGTICVQSFWRSAEFGFDSIESVRETRFRNPKLVIIRLKQQTPVGRTIRFIPIGRGVLFGEHPTVTALLEEWGRFQ